MAHISTMEKLGLPAPKFSLPNFNNQVKKQIISPRQAIKICQALEFLYDLRNFTATAKNHHFDDEALESGLIKNNLQKIYFTKKA